MSASVQAVQTGAGIARGTAENSPTNFGPAEHVLRTWAVWRARAADRRAWWKADEHMVRDVGLTRKQLIREASKPCWRK